jgi:hypothetical protein
VARIEGAETTARALGLDRARLAARMTATEVAMGRPIAGEVGGGFVEIDAGRLGLSPRTVIRWEGRDGERLEVELAAGAVIDLAVARPAREQRVRDPRADLAPDHAPAAASCVW